LKIQFKRERNFKTFFKQEKSLNTDIKKIVNLADFEKINQWAVNPQLQIVLHDKLESSDMFENKMLNGLLYQLFCLTYTITKPFALDNKDNETYVDSLVLVIFYICEYYKIQGASIFGALCTLLNMCNEQKDAKANVCVRQAKKEITRILVVENKFNCEFSNVEPQLTAKAIAAVQNNIHLADLEGTDGINNYNDIYGIIMTGTCPRFYHFTFSEQFLEAVKTGSVPDQLDETIVDFYQIQTGTPHMAMIYRQDRVQIFECFVALKTLIA
jgi:hypothetical protein